jgi:hypothetical protein
MKWGYFFPDRRSGRGPRAPPTPSFPPSRPRRHPDSCSENQPVSFHLPLLAATALTLLSGTALRSQSNYATPYTFTTLAGTAGEAGSADGIGTAARFNLPMGVAVDGAGNLYVSEQANHTVRKISSGGVVTTLAGMARLPVPFQAEYVRRITLGLGVDGIGSDALFYDPSGVAVDSSGNICVADYSLNSIRRITNGGVVTTLAGSQVGYLDGTGSAAKFFFPSGLAADGAGNLYVAEWNTSVIRKITSGGVVTTVAGLAGSPGNADGIGSAARFTLPKGVAADSAGNLYVSGNCTIRKITAVGMVTTLAGTPGSSGQTDGTGSAARFGFETNVAVDAEGNVYVADQTNHRIRKVTSGGVVTTLAGNPSGGSNLSFDGTGSSAGFGILTAIAVDRAGMLYVTDRDHTVRRGVLARPILTTPTSANAMASQSFTYTAAFSGAPSGYTASGLPAGLSFNAATGVISGTPSGAGTFPIAITATNGAGTGSATFTLSIARAPIVAASRLINLSILTALDAPGDTFTMGYVVGGSGTTGSKALVIRAAGPSLGALGVPGTLDDPKLELFAGSTKTGENDNWGGSPTVANAMAAVGAFAYLGPTSRDATSALSVASGDNSVKVSAAGSGTGAVIAEIYDATPADSFTSATPRLLNVSVLKPLGAGFTVGFVVGGNVPKNVLVRAIGPTLGTAFLLGGVVSDPQLTLFSGQTVIGANDNWGGGAPLTSAFASVGAFVLPPASRDAAVTAALSPGNYTVQVSGVGGATGTILVEIYELP